MTPEERDALLRQLRELEARMTATAQTPTAAPRPAPAARLDRQAFVEIALLCKRALEQPPFGCLHREYLLDIARLCKRALERDTREA